MGCNVYPTGTLGHYKYVVTLSEYQGKLMLSRHKDRLTWEAQGGHIEAGETPEQAARRELYEESGALEFTIQPLCDYEVEGEEGMGKGSRCFVAHVQELGRLPSDEFEMEEIGFFDTLPSQLTYPEILPALYCRAQEEGHRI